MQEFRILGPLEALDAGQRLTVASGRERALLALLLIQANRVVTTDRILDEIWGEAPPDSGAKTVAFHIARLRDALCPGRRRGDGCDALRTEPGGYLLNVAPGALDADRFERLAAEGRDLLAGDPAAARERFEQALALWRGEALADVRYESFAQPEIRRLDELRLRTIEDRIEAELALGSGSQLIGELEGLVAANPLRERLRGQLMTALYRAGRQAEALRTYDDGRRLLAEELGIDPSAELERLQRWILHQDARLGSPADRGGPRNPYKGLRAFGERDHADFYGREVLADRLVDRLAEVARDGRLLVVVGPSGSGKSSVVRAGLVPRLRSGAIPGSERWQIEIMWPGSDPFRELGAVLDRVAGHPDAGRRSRLEDGTNVASGVDSVPAMEVASVLATEVASVLADERPLLALVIDQFEELFGLVADGARRTRFLDLLAGALAAPGGRLLAIATLRADAFDQPLRSPAFGELVRTGTEIVTPLAADELERAIVRPARSVGVELEAGLTTEVIADVARQPGELPLLQYAMTELFERSDGRQLTRDGYASVGGVLGALSRRADETYLTLEPDDRETARQVLLRLVSPDENDRPTSRRALRSELQALVDDPARVDTVLDRFGRGRLLAFDRDPSSGEATVEVAHEALLSHWPRLTGWVDQARDDIRMRRRLSDAAADWLRSGRDTDFLLSGNRLDGLAAWAESTSLRLDPSERELLDASLAERQRRHAIDVARLDRERALERRAAIRLRALVVVLLAALLVVTSLGVAIYGEGETSRERADTALARELAAASIASLERDPDLSLLLAVRAADSTAGRGYVTVEAMDALHWAIQQAHAAYPTGDVPIGVRAGPHGLRGVELLPPAALIGLASGAAGRAMTDEECRTYLHLERCPTEAAAPGDVGSVLTAAGVVPVEDLAVSSLAGTSVELAADLPADLAPMLESSARQMGITVNVAPLNDADPGATRASGSLPDLLITPRPADVIELARDGQLVPLDAVLDLAAWRLAAGDYLASVGTLSADGDWPAMDGHLYGATVDATVSSLIWYPAAAFADAGYPVPRSWDELDNLTARMLFARRTPWCLGFGAGAERHIEQGAAAADIVEELVLQQAGPRSYELWAAGDLGFRTSIVEEAVRTFGATVAGDGRVLEGRDSAAVIPDDYAPLPMTLDPPLCWLHPGGSTDVLDLPAGGSAEVASFAFPPVDPTATRSVRGRVYQLAMVRDRPEVRAVAQLLVGDAFASTTAPVLEPAGVWSIYEGSGTATAGGTVDLAHDLLRQSVRDGTFRVDASDLMPRTLASAFQEAMVSSLATDPSLLGQVLGNLDIVRAGTRVP